MLKTLTIRNFALIEQGQIDWNRNLNTITGETGAGKSILLGALNLVCGGRFEKQFVMDPDRKCVVEAEFELDERFKPAFEQKELEFESPCFVRREIHSNGRSRTFINDSAVSVTDLKELVSPWIDIHSQFQTIELRNPDYFIDIIDDYGRIQKERLDYQAALSTYREHKQKWDLYLKNKEELEKQRVFRQRQFQELDQFKPQEEDAELEGRLETLNSLDQVKALLQEGIFLLETSELSIQEGIGKLLGNLRQLAKYSSQYTTAFEQGSLLSNTAQELVVDLSNQLESLDVDDSELERLSNRFDTLQNLLDKNVCSNVEELMTIYAELKQEFGQVENGNGDYETNLKEQVEQSLKVLSEAHQELHDKRVKEGVKFAKGIVQILQFLKMENCVFQFGWSEQDQWLEKGKMAVEVGFSANPGVPPQPLQKIASGGELSRIMLAIQRLAAEKSDLPTLVLDEIDSGVSGEVAHKIGALLQEMGEQMQVITITHLPQVASKGKFHLKVVKQMVKGKTHTLITELNSEERIAEIARLMSGDNLEKSAMDHAKVLLNDAIFE